MQGLSGIGDQQGRIWIIDNRKPKWVVQEELGEEFLSVHLESLWEDYGDNGRDMPLLVGLLMALCL